MAEKLVVWNDVSVNVGWGVLRGKTCVVGGSDIVADGDLHIVGLHGWLDNCNTFDTLVPLLPMGAKVLVLDLPGHGLSDHLPLGGHYNPVMYALHIRTALLKQGWKKFILMGHSMGSAVSCVFTALFPEHVKALIDLDFIAPYSTTSHIELWRQYAFDIFKAEQRYSQPPLIFSEKEAIDRLVAARFFGYSEETTVDREAAQTLLPRSTRQIDDGYAWSHDGRARSSYVNFIGGTHWIEIISSIKCPVLLILASRGTGIIPKEVCERTFSIYKRYANWVLFETVEGTHHVHLTNPECVAPVVTKFLEKVMQDNQLQAKL